MGGAEKAPGARSDQAEHPKADGEHSGDGQADCPSDRPELGAKAGDVGLRGEVFMVGAGRKPQLSGEGFGLFLLEPGGLEVAGGGEGVEGGCEQGIYSGGRAGDRIPAGRDPALPVPVAGLTPCLAPIASFLIGRADLVVGRLIAAVRPASATPLSAGLLRPKPFRVRVAAWCPVGCRSGVGPSGGAGLPALAVRLGDPGRRMVEAGRSSQALQAIH